MSDPLQHLNLWSYLREKYAADVAYSDTGWMFKFLGETHKGGEVEVGLAKHRLHVRLDPIKMNQHILSLIETIMGVMPVIVHEDAILREKLASARIHARRKVRNGQS